MAKPMMIWVLCQILFLQISSSVRVWGGLFPPEKKKALFLLSEVKKTIQSQQLTSIQAVNKVVEQWRYELKQPLAIIKDEKTLDHRLVLSSGGVSQRDIPVKLVLIPDVDGLYRLAWDISILELDFELDKE